MQYSETAFQTSTDLIDGGHDPTWLNHLLRRLRQSAAKEMSKYVGQLTWQPTAIVNEAVVKVWKSKLIQSGATRRQVMSALSQAIHDVAVDEFRRRMTVKRGSGVRPIALIEDVEPRCDPASSSADPIDLKWAIERLERVRPRQAEVIRMRFYGEFTCPEIAEAMQVSLSTVQKELREARGRLFAMLHGGFPRETPKS